MVAFSNAHKYKYCIFFVLLTVIGISCIDSLPDGVRKEMASLPDDVDFNFHVKPILSDKCFQCHGPDANARKANLRLDLEEEAMGALESGNGRSFVKGHPTKSIALSRILSIDEDYKMPPPESNLSLTEREMAVITRWIEQGSKWKKHWAFIAPEKPSIPEVISPIWFETNEIDHFIYKSLEDQSLQASEEANKEQLLRRVYLDLTGLPPSVEQMDGFLADKDSKAYEKVVESLLNTQEYAERMATEWMDVARYADSHGLHADGWRMMWPWRDWVISSFQKNRPYDEFVTWQLAGDLLPNATEEQILATAFNRNHTMTAEGGAIDEEWRLSYVYDRTETMATALLGMTIGCAKCHDHKYDQLTQREFFEMASFFNNVKELGMTGDDGNYGPMLLLADSTTKTNIQKLTSEITSEEMKLEQFSASADITAYLKQLSDGGPPDHMALYAPLDKKEERTGKNGRRYFVFDDNSDVKTYGDGHLGPGASGQAMKLEDDYGELYLDNIGNNEMYEAFSIGCWIKTVGTEKDKTQTIMGNSGEKNSFWRGWDFFLDQNQRLSARLIHSLPHNYIQVTTVDSVQSDTWIHVSMTYDGSGSAEGLHLYINGKREIVAIDYDHLYKSILTLKSNHKPDLRPVKVGKSGRAFTGENGLFRGWIDEIVFYNHQLSDLEVASIYDPTQSYSEAMINELARMRSAEYKETSDHLKNIRKLRLEIYNEVDEVMVMGDLPEPRKSFAYFRGEYSQPMYEVRPNTPSAILNFSDTLPPNRLGLAKWIFDENNPLTARVTVNRYWQMIFGRGLVNTPEDFGVQGALPSHPELLDWLSHDLVNTGWDIRALMKKIVLSATYRQSSRINNESWEKDPTNIYLSRYPSRRLEAEMIRDNALAASGLLIRKPGGESVRPYQPEGLWIEKGNFSQKLMTYKITRGDSLYRRSMYTFVKRTSPHPVMTMFDAPNREICTVKRESTNTPLQSLALLNDPQFVEASKVLAQRMQIEGGQELEDQIGFGFRCATGRHARQDELALFSQLYEKSLDKYVRDKKSAKELLTVGDYVLNDDLDVAKTAALSMVANTILNHDDAYMKR